MAIEDGYQLAADLSEAVANSKGFNIIDVLKVAPIPPISNTALWQTCLFFPRVAKQNYQG